MSKLPFLSIATLLIYTALGTSSALAAPIQFSGDFAQDDDYQFFTFTTTASGTVSLATTSYGGAQNGFVPYLHVWDSIGMDLGGNEPTNDNAVYSLDLSAPGTAGTYYVGLTVANNKAIGDFPGGTPTPTVFDQNGVGNFTYTNFSCAGLGPDGPFYGQDCGQHTGHWTLNVSGAIVSAASLWPAASVPEPASLTLALAGAAAFAPYARRRRSSVSA